MEFANASKITHYHTTSYWDGIDAVCEVSIIFTGVHANQWMTIVTLFGGTGYTKGRSPAQSRNFTNKGTLKSGSHMLYEFTGEMGRLLLNLSFDDSCFTTIKIQLFFIILS